MRSVTAYQAADGAIFVHEDECLAYERKHPEFALVGLTLPQLVAALNGEDRALADAVLVFAIALPADSPAEQGRRDFAAGVGGIVPDRFKNDKQAANDWLTGWDEASAASFKRKAA